MSAEQQTNKRQPQTHLIYADDGLLDLAIGLLIFSFGAMLLSNLAWLVGI